MGAWTEEAMQAYIDEHWPLIKDHPEECECDLCWEYVAVTQK